MRHGSQKSREAQGLLCTLLACQPEQGAILARFQSPGMALKKPTDSLRKPGEGVGGNDTLTVVVERRRSCSRKLSKEEA